MLFFRSNTIKQAYFIYKYTKYSDIYKYNKRKF